MLNKKGFRGVKENVLCTNFNLDVCVFIAPIANGSPPTRRRPHGEEVERRAEEHIGKDRMPYKHKHTYYMDGYWSGYS